MPTLAEALGLIQATACTLIEAKDKSAPALIEILKAGGWLDNVVVQSYDWTFIRQMHALAPTVPLGALGPPAERDERKLTEAEQFL